jgi:hypothetical protein
MKMTAFKPRQSLPRPDCGFVRSTWWVGRYTVTMTFDLDACTRGAVSQTNVQWSPHLPPKGSLTPAHFRQYIAGRNALYQELADIIGSSTAVVDL